MARRWREGTSSFYHNEPGFPAHWTASAPNSVKGGGASVSSWSAEGYQSCLRPGVWQLIYWPCWGPDGRIRGGAGRAEYVRVMFEAVGEPYEELEDAEFVRNFFWRESAAMQPQPVLAPPALHRDGFVLAQTASIVRYLAKVLKLMPEGGVQQEARADQICETVHELIAEGRLAFHPDHTHRKPYHTQRQEAEPYIRAFEHGRLPRLLDHFEKLLSAAGGEYFAGGSFSYVDLQVFVMLRVSQSQFPRAYAAHKMPLLRAFLQRISEKPMIAGYLVSERCRPFAGDSMM